MGEQDNNEELSVLVGYCALRGLENEIPPTFQKYVILETKDNRQAHLR